MTYKKLLSDEYPICFIASGRGIEDFENEIPAPYIRRNFSINRIPDEAQLLITGLGFYRVWINGTEITKCILAPYISNPDDIIYYDVYEISSKLHVGDNVIGIQLANGMMNCFGGYIWDFDKAPFRGEPCTAFSITAAYDNLTKEEKEEFIKHNIHYDIFQEKINLSDHDSERMVAKIIESDEKCLCHDSPLIFNDLRCGEYYDARMELMGWNEPGYNTDGWTAAVKVIRPRGVFRLCVSSPIVSYEERKPVSIQEYQNGYIYDFGVNAAGICRLKIHGRNGQEIILFHGELMEDGVLCQNNINFEASHHPQCRKVQVNRYICNGSFTGEVWNPWSIYDGFRYVYVQGISAEQAVPELLTYLVMSGDFRETGYFSCSDKTANAIQEITKRSDRSNFLWFPTDCPHREKNGWTGDAAVSTRQFLINFDTGSSLKEWARNIASAQSLKGNIPGIVPTGGWGYECGNGPAWDHVLVEIPFELYLLRNDLSCASEIAPSILRYLYYISGQRDKRGLVAIGLGDWCESNGGTSFDIYQAPQEVTDSLISMLFCHKASILFRALGQIESADYADMLRESFRNAIRRELIDFGNMTVEGNCQTSQALGLYTGIFEKGEEAEAFVRLLDFVHEYDDHIHAGMIGLRVIFRVLAQYHKADLAWKMITRKDFPAYGNWIARGMTSLPEAWTAEGKKITYSLNHHFFGDVSAWFIEYVAGLQPNPYLRDANEIRIAPTFINELKSAQGAITLPCGKASVYWERDDNPEKILLTVDVPENASGKIVLPNYWSFEEQPHKNARILAKGSFTIVKRTTT